MEVETGVENRADIESAHRTTLVAYLESEGFQCHDYENEEVLRTAALAHWDTENKTEFTWGELSDTAKDSARSRYFEPDGNWWDGVYEMFKKDGKERGFYARDISFSGFWSQGSGACWTGFIDVLEYAAYHWKDTPLRVEILNALSRELTQLRLDVSSRGRYCHEGAMDLEEVGMEDNESDVPVESPGTPWHGTLPANLWEALGYTDPSLPELNAEMLEASRDYAREIYKALEAEYEYQTSDEYIAETCETNDHRFDEAGVLI